MLRRRPSARFAFIVVASTCLAALFHAAPANASFPGTNGRVVHECILFDSNGASHKELCVSRPDGSGQQFITDTRSPRYYWEPAWSPDGKWITYGATIANAYDDDIWIRKPGDPSSAVNVTQTPNDSSGVTYYRHSHPSFARDGSKIVFTAQYQEEGEDLRSGIWTIKTDGTGLQLIRTETASLPLPVWSPTADRILFDCTGQAWDEWSQQWVDNPELCSMKADGTDMKNLTQSLEGELVGADWSPDGTKIVFSRTVPGTGWPGVADLWVMNANGTGQQKLFGNNTLLMNPIWSPDGAKVLFGSRYWGELGVEGAVMMMDADGTDAVQHNGSMGNWQPCTVATACDFVAPNTVLDQKPAAAVNATSATFAFHATEAGSKLQCSLDGQQFADCTSPVTFDDLAEGGHFFQVRAVDAAFNEDPSPSEWTWTVDLTPPDTYISFTPSGNRATFTLGGDEDGVTFLCSLDGSAFAACVSPKKYTDLVPGQHVFRAKSRDAAGNLDSTPASQSWTVPKIATTTTLAVTVKPAKILASGGLTPAHPGDAMTVKLQRKKPSGAWGVVASASPVLTADSSYAASFTRRDGTCRVVASFPGDEDHKASSKTSTQFHC